MSSADLPNKDILERLANIPQLKALDTVEEDITYLIHSASQVMTGLSDVDYKREEDAMQYLNGFFTRIQRIRNTLRFADAAVPTHSTINTTHYASWLRSDISSNIVYHAQEGLSDIKNDLVRLQQLQQTQAMSDTTK